jgi:hypothetical protein
MTPPPVEILSIVASLCNITCAIWPNLLKTGQIYFGEIFRHFYLMAIYADGKWHGYSREFLYPDSCHLSADK